MKPAAGRVSVSINNPGEAQQAPLDWWNHVNDSKKVASSIESTLQALRIAQTQRFRQLSMSAMLYGNRPAFQVYGTNQLRLIRSQAVPVGRLTFNLIQSAIDTLVSKITQDESIPYFLTAGGNWKQQRQAKKLTKFASGISYENNGQVFVAECVRDCLIMGDSMAYVYTHPETNRICWERVLATEMYVDELEGQYGRPRSMHRVKCIDRMTAANLPFIASSQTKRMLVLKALPVPEDGVATRGVTNDMVELRESWHLPSKKDAGDGWHIITIDGGCLFKEAYTDDSFPFVRLTWSKAVAGFWGQGAAAQIQGTQLEMNKLLWVQSRSLHLAGTFKVWAKIGSQVVKEHVNNQVGSMGMYAGDTPPIYIQPPPYHESLPLRIAQLKQDAFEQLGVSAMAATSKKPAGLSSGEAIREYADIQSERFYAFGRVVQQFVVDLAKASIHLAKKMHEEGEQPYAVSMPNRKGFVETINWDDIDLEEESFVTKCFNVSTVPGQPAGLKSTIAEQVQAGWITAKQGRRLMAYPDLEADDNLANASEDYLAMVFDKMVDGMVEGEDDPKHPDFRKPGDAEDPGLDPDYTPPSPEDDLEAGKELCLEYINEGKVNGLSEYRLGLLRLWMQQVQNIQAQLAPPAAPGGPGSAPAGAGSPAGPGAPAAVPAAPAVSQLLPAGLQT